MTPYAINRENFLPVVDQDVVTIIGATNRGWGIVEIDISGAGSSAAFFQLAVYSVTTAGVTPTGLITPEPSVNTAHPAAALTAPTTWGTQPVVNKLLHPIPSNAIGRYYWRATRIEEVLWCKGGADAAASRSIRALDVNGNITMRLKVIEI